MSPGARKGRKGELMFEDVEFSLGSEKCSPDDGWTTMSVYLIPLTVH